MYICIYVEPYVPPKEGLTMLHLDDSSQLPEPKHPLAPNALQNTVEAAKLEHDRSPTSDQTKKTGQCKSPYVKVPFTRMFLGSGTSIAWDLKLKPRFRGAGMLILNQDPSEAPKEGVPFEKARGSLTKTRPDSLRRKV